jgi:hypothetical protein
VAIFYCSGSWRGHLRLRHLDRTSCRARSGLQARESLPDSPLTRFRAEIGALLLTTEAERLFRVGRGGIEGPRRVWCFRSGGSGATGEHSRTAIRDVKQRLHQASFHLKTAAALGMSIPESVVARADRVIE